MMESPVGGAAGATSLPSSAAVAAATSPDGNVNLQLLITTEKNPRGIPASLFIDNCEEFLTKTGITVEAAIGAFNELYSKYKYMESQFEKSKAVYKSKVPDTEHTVEIIKMLVKQQEEGQDLETNYSLCDTIFAQAKVSQPVLHFCRPCP